MTITQLQGQSQLWSLLTETTQGLDPGRDRIRNPPIGLEVQARLTDLIFTANTIIGLTGAPDRHSEVSLTREICHIIETEANSSGLQLLRTGMGYLWLLVWVKRESKTCRPEGRHGTALIVPTWILAIPGPTAPGGIEMTDNDPDRIAHMDGLPVTHSGGAHQDVPHLRGRAKFRDEHI